MSTFQHTPVLIKEALEYLDVTPEKQYIDATLGGGGHTEAILEKGGIVLGIDQDQDALDFVKTRLQSYIESSQLKTVKGNFKDIRLLAEQNGESHVSGILFDLGVSSYQMDEDTRGFSIKRNGPLDMRMDANSNITAADIVNTYSEEELVDIFQRFGEEEQARAAAEQIIDKRKIKKIETTGELVSLLSPVLQRVGMVHPATKIFQALRIEVNSELTVLKLGLQEGLETLESGGHMVVISFHSLEDRITKRVFTDMEVKGMGKVITKKPITAGNDEVRSNPRARSAKMRVFKKN